MNQNRFILGANETKERLDLLDRQFEYLHERLVYLERKRWWQFWREKTAYEYRKEAEKKNRGNKYEICKSRA